MAWTGASLLKSWTCVRSMFHPFIPCLRKSPSSLTTLLVQKRPINPLYHFISHFPSRFSPVSDLLTIPPPSFQVQSFPLCVHRARHLFLPQLGSRTTIKQYRLVRNRNLLGHDYNIFCCYEKIQKSGRNLIICIFILISRFTRSGVVYFCPFWHHRYQEYIQRI